MRANARSKRSSSSPLIASHKAASFMSDGDEFASRAVAPLTANHINTMNSHKRVGALAWWNAHFQGDAKALMKR
jgi:hypothetical protein